MWLRLKAQSLKFLDSFVRQRGRLYPVELRMINAVNAALPPDQCNLLVQQVAQVNKIYRDELQKEVSLYHRSFSRFGFDPSIEFKNREDEMILAVVKLSRKNDKKRLKVEFWVVGGHLFQIVYRSSPTKFFGVAKLDQIIPEKIEVEICSDPQVDRWDGVVRQPVVSQSIDRIRQLIGSNDVDDLKEPYEDKIVQRELDRYNADFPETYAQMLRYCDGCRVGEVKIKGIRATWTVDTENGKFQILAERESVGLIAVKVVAVDGEIYFIDVIDDKIEKMGTDFGKALRWVNDLPFGK